MISMFSKRMDNIKQTEKRNIIIFNIKQKKIIKRKINTIKNQAESNKQNIKLIN